MTEIIPPAGLRMRNGAATAIAAHPRPRWARSAHAISSPNGNDVIASDEGRAASRGSAGRLEGARRGTRQAGRSSTRKRTCGRAPSAAAAGAALFGLLALATMQPALAARHSTGHFLVSVRVVYHCKIAANVSAQTQRVVMTLRHCPDRPQLRHTAFAGVTVQNLAAPFSARYTFTPGADRASPNVAYIDVDF